MVFRQLMSEGTYEVLAVLDGDEMRPPPEESSPSVEIAGDRFAGRAGCNRFIGQINDDGSLGPLATTMTACPPPVTEFESHFPGLLSRVDGHRETASGLTFLEAEQHLIELKEARN